MLKKIIKLIQFAFISFKKEYIYLSETYKIFNLNFLT